MAEFCLKCFNELNGSDYTASEVWLEDDFCEGCGEWKPCVCELRPKPLLWRLFSCVRRLLPFVLVLLLVGCSSQAAAPEYEHTPYSSALAQEDCFLCGGQGQYWGEDNVGIINLNSFEFVRLEINRYNGKQLIEKPAGYMQSGGLTGEDSYVHSMADPDRGYAHVQITGTQKPIEPAAIQSQLCQGCLDAVNDACIWGAPSEYGVVSFADHVIRPLVKETPWFTFGNYGIECDYKDNGEINLLVVYCPPRFE